MEKQIKKPDWTEVIAMADLSDYFKNVKSENDLNELFDRELLKYKTEVKRDETPEFIDSEIDKITGMIEKSETIKGVAKYDPYRTAKFYLKFLQKKQTEQPDIKPIAPEPIIKKEYLIFIHKTFEEWIKESSDLWIERFVYPNKIPVNPIKIESEAKEGSSRLVLLAILESIQKTTGNAFFYPTFVQERFGIKAYQKAKTIHKSKQGFKETLKECDAILKKMKPFEK